MKSNNFCLYYYDDLITIQLSPYIDSMRLIVFIEYDVNFNRTQ